MLRFASSSWCYGYPFCCELPRIVGGRQVRIVSLNLQCLGISLGFDTRQVCTASLSLHVEGPR